jgi:hypothetical protein
MAAASHGCVRMPYDFAEKVFDKPPMGMRVIISPGDVEPVEFSSSSLFVPNQVTIAAMPAKAAALAREADEATKAAATAKTALGSAKRLAANDAKLALEPVSVYVSRSTQKLYVRRDTHMRAPDGGEMYDTIIELPVSIKDPNKPIGTHIFTVVARTDTGLRWTEVTIDNGDDAKDALDRITLPQEILDRIAPTAMPRSSIIISDEHLSSETNYRTEFVVVLNDQPQGGFANRARSPEMRFARRDGFGVNRFGDRFFGDSRPSRGQSHDMRQRWGWWGSY